jgi:hypothetical protein
MENKYKVLRSKLTLFNEWEAKYVQSLPPARRLEQFFALFEIGQSYNHRKRLKMHEEHLKGLMEAQKRLKRLS